MALRNLRLLPWPARELLAFSCCTICTLKIVNFNSPSTRLLHQLFANCTIKIEFIALWYGETPFELCIELSFNDIVSSHKFDRIAILLTQPMMLHAYCNDREGFNVFTMHDGSTFMWFCVKTLKFCLHTFNLKNPSHYSPSSRSLIPSHTPFTYVRLNGCVYLFIMEGKWQFQCSLRD